MRIRWIVVMVVLAGGCKGKDASKEPTAGSGSAAVTGSASGSSTMPASGSASAGSGTVAPDASCESPCLVLVATPLDQAAAAFEKSCGKKWPAVSEADCGQLDHQRNCIYAASGYTFKKKQWKDVFAKQPWYKPRADFQERDLPAVAKANIAELKKRAQACRKGITVKPADRKLAETWNAGLAAGKPEVPPLGLSSGDRLDQAALKALLLANKAQFASKKLRSIGYAEPSDAAKAALPGKQLKAINLDFSEPDDGACGEEECGYGQWLILLYDDQDHLLAIEEWAAACPFVYLIGDGAPVLQGELVRNLNRPSLERDQGLPVSVGRCAGSVRYRVSEEKDEVTSLDELALVIDGIAIAPEVCAGGNAAICANDGVAHELRKGDSLDVTFTIPPGAKCVTSWLRANGHYVPLR